jgi:hypothetical protein
MYGINSIVISKIQNTDIFSKQDFIVNIECMCVCMLWQVRCDDLVQVAKAERHEQELGKWISENRVLSD